MAKKQLRNVRFDSNRVRLKTGETEKTNGAGLVRTASVIPYMRRHWNGSVKWNWSLRLIKETVSKRT